MKKITVENSALNDIKVTHDKIMFKFVQDIAGDMFREVTSSGFIIMEKAENQLSKARWGQVYGVGSKVSGEITQGMYILIENLMWTQHVVYKGEKMWTTTEEKVMAVSDELPIAV